MEIKLEVRYENVLDMIRQMPSEQVEKLFADIARILKKSPSANAQARAENRAAIVAAVREMDQGIYITTSKEGLYDMLHN